MGGQVAVTDFQVLGMGLAAQVKRVNEPAPSLENWSRDILTELVKRAPNGAGYINTSPIVAYMKAVALEIESLRAQVATLESQTPPHPGASLFTPTQTQQHSVVSESEWGTIAEYCQKWGCTYHQVIGWTRRKKHKLQSRKRPGVPREVRMEVYGKLSG